MHCQGQSDISQIDFRVGEIKRLLPQRADVVKNQCSGKKLRAYIYYIIYIYNIYIYIYICTHDSLLLSLNIFEMTQICRSLGLQFSRLVHPHMSLNHADLRFLWVWTPLESRIGRRNERNDKVFASHCQGNLTGAQLSLILVRFPFHIPHRISH